MKKSFLACAFVSFVLFSCGVVNNAQFGKKEFDVASSKPALPGAQAAGADVAAIQQPQTNEVVAVSAENNVTDVMPEITADEKAMAMAPADDVSLTEQEDAKIMIANNLRATAQTLESKFAQRMINKTAERIEMSAGKAQGNQSFFKKLQSKIYGKILDKKIQKYGASAMDTADILAIVSLAAGVAAWITYYGSFLFGIAAIVTGIIALRRGTGRRGMAITGIVLGAVGIFLWIFLLAVVIAVW